MVNEQYGFRHKVSTETAAFSLINNILKSIDNRKILGGMFLDLQKAFDCVDHDILLEKLNFYGISGKSNELMKSYINPSAWSDGHCPHAARSHSFVYISTS